MGRDYSDCFNNVYGLGSAVGALGNIHGNGTAWILVQANTAGFKPVRQVVSAPDGGILFEPTGSWDKDNPPKFLKW